MRIKVSGWAFFAVAGGVAPLAASVAGTIAFRFASLWLPFPMAIRGASMLAKLTPQENEPEPALA